MTVDELKNSLGPEKIKIIEETPLTKVKSGDQNNGVFINYFDSLEKRLKFFIKNPAFLGSGAFDILSHSIIGGSTIFDDDALRIITTALTFTDIIAELSGDSLPVKNPNVFYFALLINYNAENSKGITKIKSMSQLDTAVQMTRSMNYQEYVAEGPKEDAVFSGDYKSIQLTPKHLNTSITLMLPIVNYKILPFFTFATEKVAGKVIYDIDSNRTEYAVPASVWMNMVKDGVNARKSPKFPKHFDFGQLKKVVASDPKWIRGIIGVDLVKVASIMNAFKHEFDEDGHFFVLDAKKTMDYLDLGQTNAVEWEQPDGDNPSGKIRLLSKSEFYVVDITNNSFDIYVP